MDAGSSTHPIRKAFGALKDSTRVGLAMVNSGHKEVDVAVVKATSHDEVLPKEKHVQTIFDAVSDSRPQADIAYCIHALGRRLAKTHNWTVALKTLIVIHRALRKVHATFREELIHHNQIGELILNLSHFSDDSSQNAWDYSAWVRSYALYIEELLECFRTLNYDVQIDHSRTKDLDTPNLLEQLTALQQLLFRLLACQPEQVALDNFLIQHALAMVADESIKVYLAISDGTLNLADKFFQMQRHDAVRALEIYKKAGNQAERLAEFFEICRGLDFGQGQEHIQIERPSASLMTAMEGHVKDAAQNSSPSRKSNSDGKAGSIPKSIAAFEADLEARGKQDADFLEKSDASAT